MRCFEYCQCILRKKLHCGFLEYANLAEKTIFFFKGKGEISPLIGHRVAIIPKMGISSTSVGTIVLISPCNITNDKKIVMIMQALELPKKETQFSENGGRY